MTSAGRGELDVRVYARGSLHTTQEEVALGCGLWRVRRLRFGFGVRVRVRVGVRGRVRVR